MRELITRAKYGKIKLKLKDKLDSMGLNRNEFSRMIEVRFEVVNKWYNNDTLSRIDADILSRICYVLECDITKIIEYVPDQE